MAATGRSTRAPLIHRLREEPYAFDFFQAVRILEGIRSHADPVGTGREVAEEAVRFRSWLGLGFPPSDVVSVTGLEEEKLSPGGAGPPEVQVSFLGLAGEPGPLPRWVTELLLERVRKRDTAFRDFLDIFNHRLVSIQYRIRAQHRVGQTLERPDRSVGGRVLSSLAGLGTPGLQGRLGVVERGLPHYAGLLSQRPRSTSGLVGILRDYFRLPFRAREMVGCWRVLDDEQRTRLTAKRGGAAGLGGDATLGGRAWDQAGALELEVGPLSLKDFRRFLPAGDRIEPLASLVRFYLPGHVQVRLRPVLAREEVPGLRLGGGEGEGPRLGWTSWLGRREPPDHARGVTVPLTPSPGASKGGAEPRDTRAEPQATPTEGPDALAKPPGRQAEPQDPAGDSGPGAGR